MRHQLRHIWLAGFFAISCGGCATIAEKDSTSIFAGLFGKSKKADTQAAQPTAAATATKETPRVWLEGRQMVAENGDVSSISESEFIGKLANWLSASRYRSAAYFVSLHQEVAVGCLEDHWDDVEFQSISIGQIRQANLLRFMATELDKLCPAQQGTTWVALLDLTNSRSDVVGRYHQLRQTAWKSLQAGEEMDKNLRDLQSQASQLAHPIVEIDLHRTLAASHLLADRDAQALAEMSRAAALADQWHRFEVSSELWLSCNSIARRLDDQQATSQAWLMAVDRQCQMLAHPQARVNPNFWLRADLAMPATVQWPESVGLMRDKLSSFALPSAMAGKLVPNFVVQVSIASSLFERNASQRALMQFKKAEAIAAPEDVGSLRVMEAKCMCGLGSEPTAIAILSSLARDQNPMVVASAVSTMGSIRVHAKAYEQGTQMLERSMNVIGPSYQAWPGYWNTVADHGIVLMILGQTDDGLAQLREAQTHLAPDRSPVTYITALKNEIEFCKAEGRKDEASVAQAKLAEFEAAY